MKKFHLSWLANKNFWKVIWRIRAKVGVFLLFPLIIMEKIGEEFLRMSARHLIYNASDNFCGCFGFFFFSDFLFFNPEIFLHLTHFCYFAKKEKKRMCNCENQENLKKSCKFHISLNSLLRNICFVEQLDFLRKSRWRTTAVFLLLFGLDPQRPHF